MHHLIETLEKSLEKHGEQPLTNKWLLNLLKTAQKKMENEEIPFWQWGDSDDIF